MSIYCLPHPQNLSLSYVKNSTHHSKLFMQCRSKNPKSSSTTKPHNQQKTSRAIDSISLRTNKFQNPKPQSLINAAKIQRSNEDSSQTQ